VAASRPLRLGLVGCGRLAEAGYLPAIRGSGEVQLVAVADPNLSRCRHLAPELPAYENAADMIVAGDAEALVLATPAAAHLADARLAARAGLPALVEKPPAPDSAGALALAGLTPPPWIGFNRRFDPMLDRLSAAVAADGPVRLELGLWYRRRSWSPLVVADEVLLDLGPHLIDLAGWLAGARVVRVRTLRLHPQRAVLELDLERGSARLECANDRPYRERFVAARQGGERLAREHRGGLVAGAVTRLKPRGSHPRELSLRRQLEAFARAVRGDDPGWLATAAEGARVMSVIDAARRSATAGGEWLPAGSA
jgi:predicted dehydrogenase